MALSEEERKERWRQRSRQWRLDNPEENRERKRLWREKNRDKDRAQKRRYKERHPEARERENAARRERWANDAEYRASEIKRIVASKKESYARNPDKAIRKTVRKDFKKITGLPAALLPESVIEAEICRRKLRRLVLEKSGD